MKNVAISVIALGLGVAAGWAFRTAQHEKVKPAAAQTSAEVAVNAATTKSDEGLPVEVHLSPKEIALRLYDTWDEAQAERWLATLSVDELREVIAIVAPWPDRDLRDRFILSAMDAWSKIDLVGVLEEVAKEDKLYHNEAKAWIAGGIAATDPAKAFGIMGKVSLFPDNPSEWKTGYRWLRENAAGALRYWDEHSESEPDVGSLGEYGRDLSTPALAELTEKVKGLKRQDLRDRAIRALTWIWQERDPVTAFRLP